MIRACKRCGDPVLSSENPKYSYQCMRCDEDLRTFETEEVMRSLTFDEVNRQLNEGMERTAEELEVCKKWLIEFASANELSLRELNELCWKDSVWVFDQIFCGLN